MLYAAQTNLEIVARLGVYGDALADTQLVFVPDPAVEARMGVALAALLPGRPRVGLVPAGTWPAKTAPPQLFASVAERLGAAGCGVVLLWGPGERDVARHVVAASSGRAVEAPQTNLEELAALLAGLDLVITHDSGVKHLAGARGTPTLTLFGPTDPRAWLPPRGPHAGVHARVPCLGCNFTRCSHQLCMRRLDADAIVEHALRMLDRPAPP
jgi:ADP-heptose:LPS heptosyltransferase